MKTSILPAATLVQCLFLLGPSAVWQVPAAVYQESGGQVVIEAENFHTRTTNANTRHWHLAPDEDGIDFLADTADPFSNARGGKYMQMIPNTGLNNDVVAQVGIEPYLDYKVNIATPGTYQLYLRRNGTGGGGTDSMYGQIVELMDGIEGVNADWFRYAGVENGDFALTGWQGVGGRELVDGAAGGTPATFAITTPGLYTVRLSYREDGVGVDSLILQLSSMAAPDNTAPNYGPPQSPVSTTFGVSVKSRTPNAAATGVFPDSNIRVELEDGGSTQINTNSIILSLNGTPVTPTITKAGTVTTISFAPPGLFPPGTSHTLTLIFQDTAATPQSSTNTWTFTVPNYVTLPTEWALPSGSGNASATGFKITVVQGPATPTLANTAARAEAQLAGLLINPVTGQPFANEANPGPFDDPDVINYEQDAGSLGLQGNFRPDEAMPGIPGTTSHTDNIAMEIVAYLQLSAGAHIFGVNSDDGFVVSVGPALGDVLGRVLGRFDGGRGSADTLFNFVVPVDGVYPFRLIYYEGNGDANLEWFSVNPTNGQKILINDLTNSLAVRAFREATPATPTKPSVEVASPVQDSTFVPVTSTINLTMMDGTRRVLTNTIQLSLNGTNVAGLITQTGGVTRVAYDPPGNLPGFLTNSIQLIYQDDGGLTRTGAWSFKTERPPTGLAPIRQDVNGFAIFEAENFDTNAPGIAHNWDFAMSPAGFSGPGTMYALPESGVTINMPTAITDSPRLDYRINFARTGTHYLWVRGSDGGGDSITAGIDDVDPTGTTLDNIDEPACCGNRLIPGGETLTWINAIDTTGSGQAVFDITTAGEHTLHLWMREDGMIVDKVIITTDPSFVPSGASLAESRRVGDPFVPVISLSSPTNNDAFAKGAPITIAATATDADGTIARVEFFEGTNKIGEDTTFPFSIVWSNDQDRVFTLSARATDNSGDVATSSPVRILVGNPSHILFLVSLVPPTAADSQMQARLETRGFLVTVMDDDLSTTADADGKNLIVVSATVASGQVNTKFQTSAVPIVNMEQAIQDDLLMTLNVDTIDRGTVASQTDIVITNATHALAAGLTNGTYRVTTVPATFVFGRPAATATIVARMTNGNAVLYAYDTGALLIDGITPAPARRIVFFLDSNTSIEVLNPTGLALFDAAINWGLNLTVAPGALLSISRNGTAVTITWTGAGVLEQTDSLSPVNWTTAPSQLNPQTVTATGTRYYRIRQ